MGGSDWQSTCEDVETVMLQDRVRAGACVQVTPNVVGIETKCQ